MKKNLIQSSLFLTAVFGAISCSHDAEPPVEPLQTDVNALTFTINVPGSEKVTYTRADEIHESSEYAINTLSLYEFEVDDDNSETLVRVIKSNGNGKYVLDLSNKTSQNSYKFSIIVPEENIGKKYTYRFVANDPIEDPETGSDYTVLKAAKATRILAEGNTADALSNDGVVMSGVATCGGQEIITMSKDLQCEVAMTRIVSRIDIKYETPNLKVTSVELRNAPIHGFIFPQDETPTIAGAETLTLSPNTAVTLPGDYLKNLENLDIVELKKAFYLYERSNQLDDSAIVHIDYEVDANGKTYHGSADVPFAKADGSYIDAERNHLYTIVLGNGKEPVAGKVSVTFNVIDWDSEDVEAPLTTDDKKID